MLEDPVFKNAITDGIQNYFTENANIASTRHVEWDELKTTLEQEAAWYPTQTAELQEAHVKPAELLESLQIKDYKSYTQLKHSEAEISGALLERILHDVPQAVVTHEITTSGWGPL